MKAKWKRPFVLLAAGLILLVGVLIGFRGAILVGMGRWLVVETPVREADLVVALGGDRERQEEAVRLLRQGLARWVLFVGSDVRLRDYRCLGVPEDQALVPPGPAYTTYEEAVATRKVVEERGLKSVLIVTSRYHLRRARWTFDRVLRDLDVAVATAPAPDASFSIDRWWTRHVGRKAVVTEYLGLLYYWLSV